MSTQLPIDQLTIAEKLRIMEELWDDLRSRAEEVPMPQWHRDQLDEREQFMEAGNASFDDWDAAKQRIIKQTS